MEELKETFFVVFLENEQESPPALARLEFTINEAHIGMLSPTRTAASQRHRTYACYHDAR